MNQNQQSCPIISSYYVHKMFHQCKDAIKYRCSGRLAQLVDQEFNVVFTFGMAFIFQFIYLYWLISGGSVAENNFLVRYFYYMHLAALLIGGAIIRCFICYYLSGGQLPENGIFDYPLVCDVNGKMRVNSSEQQTNKEQAKKEKTSPPQSAISDPDSDDDAKISKDFESRSTKTADGEKSDW